jgi:hypothetical protein
MIFDYNLQFGDADFSGDLGRDLLPVFNRNVISEDI